MTEVPAETPVTNPLEASIVAIPGVPLLHVPSAVAFASVDVPLTHTVLRPVMAVDTGSAGTVSVC
jgi:hypothetical protein